MPWPMRIIAPDYGENGWPPGGCWYLPVGSQGISDRALSPEYLRDWADKRPPIVVVLPQRLASGDIVGWPFCPDECATGHDTGWVVTGTLPDITCSPSVDASPAYHGWIQHGVVSDGLLP